MDITYANIRIPQKNGLYDLVVRKGKIAAIKPAHGGRENLPWQRIDLEGAWVSPSLWDEHVHVDLVAMEYSRLDLGDTSSAAEVLEKVKRFCFEIRSGRKKLPVRGDFPLIIHGAGYRASAWPDQAKVSELDAVSEGFPVILISGDAHSGWMNTKGLELLGLPPHESIVSEDEWFRALYHYDKLPDYEARLRYGLEQLAQTALSKGVLGIKDMSFSAPLWEREIPSNWQGIEIELCAYPNRLEERIKLGYSTGSDIDFGIGKPVVKQGPVKIITDGSLGTKTAFCKHAYDDGSYGVSNYRGEKLHEICEYAHAHGYTLALHAIGDQAITDVLEAFKVTGASGSIEHVQLLEAGQAEEMAKLGITASIQPAHMLDDYYLAEKIWHKDMGRCYAFADLYAAGVTLALGSDAPVAPLDPWLAMGAAVYRGNIDQTDKQWIWHQEQALTPKTALLASTRYREIKPGLPADLIFTASSPLGDDLGLEPGADELELAYAQANKLVNMQVIATVKEGKTLWTR